MLDHFGPVHFPTVPRPLPNLRIESREVRKKSLCHLSRAAKREGFKQGGFPIWTCPSFFCPFLSFLGLSRFFRDFPGLLGDGPGIFPIRPFPLSRPIKSTYEEQSRKGPRRNLDIFPNKVGNARVWKPPGLASLESALTSLRLGNTGQNPLLLGHSCEN